MYSIQMKPIALASNLILRSEAALYFVDLFVRSIKQATDLPMYATLGLANPRVGIMTLCRVTQLKRRAQDSGVGADPRFSSKHHIRTHQVGLRDFRSHNSM